MQCMRINFATFLQFSVIVIHARVQARAATQLIVDEFASNNKTTLIRKLQKLRGGMEQCVQEEQQLKKKIFNCWQSMSLRFFDELMSAAVIPIRSGIRLVRTDKRRWQMLEDTKMELLDDMHNTDLRQDMQHTTWPDWLRSRLATAINTHNIEINLKQLTDDITPTFNIQLKQTQQNDPISTARHRRHRYNMIITMIFGVVALGAVLVPMGFQLLSVVSGKALLLAKMALLLASINGLKRVANSGVHYGLYHAPSEPFSGSYYDRGDMIRPRNVPSLTLSQPIDIGI